MTSDSILEKHFGGGGGVNPLQLLNENNVLDSDMNGIVNSDQNVNSDVGMDQGVNSCINLNQVDDRNYNIPSSPLNPNSVISPVPSTRRPLSDESDDDFQTVVNKKDKRRVIIIGRTANRRPKQPNTLIGLFHLPL